MAFVSHRPKVPHGFGEPLRERAPFPCVDRAQDGSRSLELIDAEPPATGSAEDPYGWIFAAPMADAPSAAPG